MSETRDQALRGARALAVSTVFAKALGFGSQLILARLLAREHFGVFAFAIAVTTLLGTLSNLEPRRDILRDPQRAPCRARAYLAVQAALGLTVGVVLFLCAGSIASWIADGAAAEPLLRALCLVPVLEALRLPALAMLEVRMHFRRAARLENQAALIQVGSALALAIAGAGPWAFVAGFYSGSLYRCVGVWRLTGAELLGVRCSREDLVSVWSFGGPLLLANVLTAWYWKVDDLIVGGGLGWVAVGLYAIAFEIPRALIQVTESLGRVGLTLLGQKTEDVDARQRRVFGVAVRASFAVIAPAVAVGIVHGEVLIRCLFGDKWLGAVPAFQVFLVFALLRGSFRHWVDVASSRGRPELLTRACLVTSTLLPIVGYLSLPWGILGMALSVVAVWCVPAPFYLGWVRRELGVRFGPMLAPGFVSLALSLASGWGLLALFGDGDVGRFGIMAVQVVVFAAVMMRADRELFWMAASAFSPREMRDGRRA